MIYTEYPFHSSRNAPFSPSRIQKLNPGQNILSQTPIPFPSQWPKELVHGSTCIFTTAINQTSLKYNLDLSPRHATRPNGHGNHLLHPFVRRRNDPRPRHKETSTVLFTCLFSFCLDTRGSWWRSGRHVVRRVAFRRGAALLDGVPVGRPTPIRILESETAGYVKGFRRRQRP